MGTRKWRSWKMERQEKMWFQIPEGTKRERAGTSRFVLWKVIAPLFESAKLARAGL